jgi:hypothetical protein
MIKDRSEMPRRKIEIDLNSSEGNAFYLLGLASSLSKQLHYSRFKTQCILDNMKLSTYEMLIEIFDKEFGHLVILYR